MKYFKKLVGERIYLSPVNVEDAEKYVEWFCDFRMTDGIGKSSSMMTVEAEREWLENSLKNNDFNFAIVNIETDELIGNCGIMNINQKDRCAELGIFIGNEEHRSKGYGAEVLRILLDYCFNYLKLNNGVEMPQLGLGTFLIPEQDLERKRGQHSITPSKYEISKIPKHLILWNTLFPARTIDMLC